MNQNPYLKQYQKTHVETATPEKILILLYDGAIQFLNKAKIALGQKNIEETHNNILGCEKIILEFMNTLDMEANPELGQKLYALYEFLYNTLVDANIQQDEKKVDLVLEHLKSLRSTWQEAIDMANKEHKTMTFHDDEEFEDDDETKEGYA